MVEPKNKYVLDPCTVPKSQTRCCIFIALVFVLITSLGMKRKADKGHDTHFDYLIFTQRWLPSACIAFEEKNSSSYKPNHCILPQNYQMWAVHGLWPTQYNKMGPFFCNSDKFDIKALYPILESLKEYWPNIEAEQSLRSLWRHEWEKHGTCAEQLDFLNSEIKYFNETLNLYWKHNITALFVRNNILASHDFGYNVLDIIDLIERNYGKKPYISCIEEVETKQPYLSEVRMCYNKNLTLIDCDEPFNLNSTFSSDKITNCPINTKLIYPDVVPPLKKNDDEPEPLTLYENLHLWLYTVEFLMWAFS